MNDFVDITGKIDNKLVDYDLSANCAPVLNLLLQTHIFSNTEKREAQNFDSFRYVIEQNGSKQAKIIEIRSLSDLTINHFNLLTGILSQYHSSQKGVLVLSSSELSKLLTRKKLENKQLNRIYSMITDLTSLIFTVKSYTVINEEIDLHSPDSVQHFTLFDNVTVDTRSSVNGSVCFSAVSFSLNSGVVDAYREQGSKIIRQDLLNKLSMGYSKALYRHFVAIYTGISQTLKIERTTLYRALGLDLGDTSYGNRKIKQALADLVETGVVKSYVTTRGRSYLVELNDTVFDMTGKKSREELINETLTLSEEDTSSISIEDFLDSI